MYIGAEKRPRGKVPTSARGASRLVSMAGETATRVTIVAYDLNFSMHASETCIIQSRIFSANDKMHIYSVILYTKKFE